MNSFVDFVKTKKVVIFIYWIVCIFFISLVYQRRELETKQVVEMMQIKEHLEKIENKILELAKEVKK